MPSDSLAEAQELEVYERQRAEGVLQDLFNLKVQVAEIQRDIHEGKPLNRLDTNARIQELREAKDEAKSLVNLATEVSQQVLESALQTDAAQLKDALHLSTRIQDSASSTRDFVERAYDDLVAQDRMALIADEAAASKAARHHLRTAWLVNSPKPDDRKALTAVPLQESLPPTTSKIIRRAQASSQEITLSSNSPPIGVHMTGEAQMPRGWAIPGNVSMNWMWAQMTIMGTADTLLLPIRRCDVQEVQEALGKMLGVPAGDISLLVKQGCCLRKLIITDQVPSKVLVKGIKSWERQKQAYKHPFSIIGAGHLGLRQALECLKQKVTDFVVFERLDRVGGEAWLRLANASSRLQTEFSTYHLQFDEAYPLPQSLPTWPSRDEILKHFQDAAAGHGILAHVQLKTNVTGTKIEKMSRLQQLEEGKGDSDPTAQHFKLSLQHQAPYDGITSKKDAAKSKKPKGAAEGDAGGGPAPEKTSFLAAAVMMFPGNLCVPREVVLKGEEVFGGPVAYGMNDGFDYAEAEGKVVGVCGMGSLAVENVQTCLQRSAKSCYLICRRKNLTMPRAVSWFVNQSTIPPSVAEVLKAMLPMYKVATDDPWGYYSVSSDASLIRQESRFPVSDFLFLALYYGRVEVVVGEAKRLLHQMMVLEDGRKLEMNCLVKAYGFTGSWEVDSVMHVSKMFGHWPESDFRRWIYCDSIGLDFMNLSTTSVSPVAMRMVEMSLYYLHFPKPDFKELVELDSMPMQWADAEGNQPAYVLSARSATAVLALVVAVNTGLQERDYYGIKRKRQFQCQSLEEFVSAATTEWRSYCDVLSAGTGMQPPAYPYTTAGLSELVSKGDSAGKKRMVQGVDSWMGGSTDDERQWNSQLKMFC